MRAAVVLIPFLAVACGSSAPPPGAESLGLACELSPDAGTSARDPAWRTDAPGCASALCIRPATAARVSPAPDTGPLCSSDCRNDSDCPGKGKCATRFLCVVPFTEGPLACRRLCVCNDFLGLFSGAAEPLPAACRGGADGP